eukprot:scaffold31703_cov49-Phaeocystis_antarctica.AAC.2
MSEKESKGAVPSRAALKEGKPPAMCRPAQPSRRRARSRPCLPAHSSTRRARSSPCLQAERGGTASSSLKSMLEKRASS